MKSLMMSMLVQEFTQGTAEEFCAAFPFDVLVWEPTRWAPARVGKVTAIVEKGAPRPVAGGSESLVLALEPRSDGRDVVLGRTEDCDLCLNDATLSARHLTFVRGPGGWSVTDLSSRNGTEVDQQRLIPGLHVELTSGSTIHAGQVLLRFHTAVGLGERIAQHLAAAKARARGAS